MSEDNPTHIDSQAWGGFGLSDLAFVSQAQDESLQRLLAQTEQAWEQQDYAHAIALLEHAATQQPRNPSILLELARAHGLRYDYEAADGCLEEAIALAPQKAELLEQAARRCLEFEQIDRAIGYLERACGEPDPTMGALITLADIYLRDRKRNEAAGVIDRAARLNKADPRVIFERAKLCRIDGAHDQAEALFGDLVSGSTATPGVRIRALYELADIFDRSARYDQAMAALLHAKSLQQPMAGACHQALQLMQDRAIEMEQTITTAVLTRWRDQGSSLHPSRRIALLCGHPRSGTTLLEQVLDAHDQIISAEETKAMHDEAYLPVIRDVPEGTGVLESLDAATPELLCHARDNYFRCIERLVGEPIGGRMLIDKNPALNVMIPMVVRVFPEARFLVAVRDPRDVVLSCFMQALPLTPISSAFVTLERAVKQYASSMGFWLAMRPRLRGQWLEVRYEQMVQDLPGTTRAVLKFLGVDYDEKVLDFVSHARGKRVNSPSHADVVKPLYRTAMGRWRNYEKHLAPYFGELDRFVWAFGYE